jgi:recombination protein RecA
MTKGDEIDALVASVLKKAGKGAARRLGNEVPLSEVREVVPTPLGVVNNYVIGAGGLPVGRFIELFAEEGVGKTSFILGTIAAAQQAGAITALVETERRLSDERIRAFGVDKSKLILSEPDTLEDMLLAIEGVIDAAGATPILIGVDSICPRTRNEKRRGLVKGEKKKGSGDSGAIVERARVLTDAIRTMSVEVCDRRICILASNHLKVKIGLAFGDKTRTAGGDQLKFYATLRLQLMGGSAAEVNGEIVGKDITVLAKKNILAPPFRKARIRLLYSGQWDDQWSTIAHAKEIGILSRSAEYSPANYAKALELLERCHWLPSKKSSIRKGA